MPSGAESKIREAIDIALKHQREGRLRAAGNIYRRVLRVEPENPDALHFLGVIAHKVGRPDLAIELLERSITADPARVGFRLNLGSLYLKQQKVDQAIACYRDAIALEPASASAHAHLAGALARQGKLEEANTAFARATELKPLPHAVPPQKSSTAPAPEPIAERGSPAPPAAVTSDPEASLTEPALADTKGLLNEPTEETTTPGDDEQADAWHPERSESADDFPEQIIELAPGKQSDIVVQPETEPEPDPDLAESFLDRLIEVQPGGESEIPLELTLAADPVLEPAEPAASLSVPFMDESPGAAPEPEPAPLFAEEPEDASRNSTGFETATGHAPQTEDLPVQIAEPATAETMSEPSPTPPHEPAIVPVEELEAAPQSLTLFDTVTETTPHIERVPVELSEPVTAESSPGPSPIPAQDLPIALVEALEQDLTLLETGTESIAQPENLPAEPAEPPIAEPEVKVSPISVDDPSVSLEPLAEAVTVPELEPVEQPVAPPAAEVAPTATIEFVVPIEPEVGDVAASGNSADHAVKAALALQYAWALHFDPAHHIPSPVEEDSGMDEEESPLDAELFALRSDAPVRRDETGLREVDSISEPVAVEHQTDLPVDRWHEGSILPLPEPDAIDPMESAEAGSADVDDSFELDDDAPVMESLGPLTLAGESVEMPEAGSPEPAAEADLALLDSIIEEEPVDAGAPDVVMDSSPAESESLEPALDSPVEVLEPPPTEPETEDVVPAPPEPLEEALDAVADSSEELEPAFETVYADVALEAAEAHVRPGLLGDAHEHVLVGGIESSGEENNGLAAPAIDRLAETLPLPGAAGIRLNRDAAATAPATGRSRPPSAESLRRRGVALISFRRLDEAIHLLNRAVSLRPRFAEAHRDLGGAMLRKGDLEGAIASLKRALQLRPSFAEAWGSLGDAYQLEGKIGQAIRCYRRLLNLVPRAAKVHSNMLLSMNYDPRFSAEQVFQEHVRWAERHADPLFREIQPHSNDRTLHRRLMIGYVSPDFRRHSVNYFAEPVLAGHYRPDFHVTCYSDVIRPDGVTRGLADLSDDFRDTRAMNDEQLAEQVRADGIDILVDLSGHTGNNRLGTFARKPAPVQVTYLGYPNTTGLSTIDYRITDGLADPPGLTERMHSEELIRLPETFLCYQPPPHSPDVGPLPCLKTGYITFGCFNILAKITDEVMALWARIMQELPNSRLVLKGRSSALSNENRRQHVRDIFVNNGISPTRLELLGKEPSYAQHLSHYGRLDIAFDPFPYNGTTTTCEALWMGLPVITLAGDRHVSRVGVSILTNVGLPELIAGTPDEYVQIATRLADSPKDLARLRSTLRERMLRSPLTDSIRLTRALEAEYRNMWIDWSESSHGSTAPRDTLRLTDH